MPLRNIRNIGIAAHIDAGKTTCTERLLFFTGSTRRLGEVHDGKAVMDFMKQEQERGITIASAAISCSWKNVQINIIDTPGHVDFTVEVERSLRVIDGMVAVFCSVGGVQPQSETVWNQADRYRVPRIAFVNKMDRTGADFFGCIGDMEKQLDAHPFPFHIPYGSEETFQGHIDIITQKATIFKDFEPIECEVPAEYKEQAVALRIRLIEVLADFDEQIMQLYLNGQSVSNEVILKAARDATLKLLITPVFCGAAYKNKGIEALLDAILQYLPSPMDVGAILGTDINDSTKALKRQPSKHEPLAALAFKLIHDPFVGQQTFTRIYSGEMTSGMKIFNSTRQEFERIGRILKIKAKEREDVDVAGPGEIVALIGMKTVKTGDTLCLEEYPILLENIFIPPAVIELKIAPPSQNEEEKLGSSLRKLAMEDPSFHVRVDHETEETIISGMGELHLEIIVDRLKTDFGVVANVSKPAVAFKETITVESTYEHKFVKQTGGKGQYAHCILRLETNPGKGFEFVDTVKGGRIPKEYIPSIKKGIEEAMQKGVYAGFPVVDVKVVVLDGSYHEVDSSDMAFRTCGSICFKKAFLRGGPTLLEPMMKIEINSPDEYIGDVLGDFGKRRGKVEDLRRFRKGAQKILGFTPLKEMFGYATDLRSISSGRANYSMEFFRYVKLPDALSEDVLTELRKKQKEEEE